MTGDVFVSEVLAHDRPVLAFDRGIVVALASAGFGKFEMQYAQQAAKSMVDVIRTVVGVEAEYYGGGGRTHGRYH